MNKHLVIGASGMVGEHLFTALRELGREAIATYNQTFFPSASHLNIIDKDKITELLKAVGPDIVHLPAALTNVDYCENHPQESYAINVAGVQNVVQAANGAGARLVYFSTDYIFDGKNGPYSEEAPANPISEYGRQKLEAEHYIALFAKDYLIIRTTVVYGWERQGKNFIYRLIKSLKEGMSVKVPVDQIGSPTYANNLAQIAISLAETSLRGVLNIAGSSLVNRYEFAKKAAQIFSLDENLILPVKTASLSQSAKRPMEAGLLTAKVSAVSTIPIVDYKDGLAMMAKEQSLI
ncbi:MAG: SDR family oxidoreductase [Anaerolineales bacterium]|nr:SDR family oxidoreductase [Anaerolineales bacterium]